jgi:DNA-binding protein Fis
MIGHTQQLTAYKIGFQNIILSPDDIKIVLRETLERKTKEYYSNLQNDEVPEMMELSEFEIEKALFGERMRRQGDINLKKHWGAVKTDVQALKLDKNKTKQMFEYEFNRTQGVNFEYDQSNAEIMDQLFMYFSDDPGFNGSLKKGICLIGNVGCGKSAIMESFKSNSKQSFIIDSCRKISYDFSKNGFEYIEKFTEVLKTVRDRFGFYERAHCFDDFGAETVRKHYGDKANIMEEILTSRYDLRRNEMTHCTTNLIRSEIKEFYGVRVDSRFDEMFNIFVFVGSKDHRKDKK